MIMNSFLDLEATKSAMDLVEEIYRITKTFPREELFGLVSQMRRASTSIVANIAEGFGRYTYLDKARHYTIARGECSEVSAFLHITIRVKLLSSDDAATALSLAEQTGKLLSGLIASSRNRHHSSS